MPTAIRTYATLELSQAAYDEIEKKLLEAGYEHLFARGPGSEIDMSGLTVTGPAKQEDYKPNKYTRHINAEDWRKFLFSDGRPMAVRMTDPGYVNEPDEQPRKGESKPIYCFMCDTMVKERCSRDNCLYAANERVRADLGLGQHPQ